MRRSLVADAINSLEISVEKESPLSADIVFEASVVEWAERTGASPVEATFFRTLEALPSPGEQTRRVIEGVRAGKLEVDERDPIDRWLLDFAKRLSGGLC